MFCGIATGKCRMGEKQSCIPLWGAALSGEFAILRSREGNYGSQDGFRGIEE